MIDFTMYFYHLFSSSSRFEIGGMVCKPFYREMIFVGTKTQILKGLTSKQTFTFIHVNNLFYVEE